MRVTVRLIGELRRLAGRRDVFLDLTPDPTLRAFARALSASCGPAFCERVLTPDGDLQSHVAVFVDGEQVATSRDGIGRLAGSTVELMLLPMFEGG